MAAPFTIHESADSGLVRLALAGEVDLSAVPIVRDQVSNHLTSDAVTGVVIDLSAVTFIDSSGIGVLIGCLRLANEAGKAFQARGAEGRAKAVLDLTGVTEILAGTTPLSAKRRQA